MAWTSRPRSPARPEQVAGILNNQFRRRGSSRRALCRSVRSMIGHSTWEGAVRPAARLFSGRRLLPPIHGDDAHRRQRRCQSMRSAGTSKALAGLPLMRPGGRAPVDRLTWRLIRATTSARAHCGPAARSGSPSASGTRRISPPRGRRPSEFDRCLIPGCGGGRRQTVGISTPSASPPTAAPPSSCRGPHVGDRPARPAHAVSAGTDRSTPWCRPRSTRPGPPCGNRRHRPQIDAVLLATHRHSTGAGRAAQPPRCSCLAATCRPSRMR